jgi:cathepsin A (carboxypeptidase C)
MHPESWNSNSNIFFVDQPIGVGFSYADYGETVVGSDSIIAELLTHLDPGHDGGSC